FAEEDVGEQRSGKLERLRYVWEVIDDRDDADHRGHVQNRAALRGRHFLVGHRCVARAEVDSLLGELLDAAAGSDRLVVDFYSVLRGILAEPLRVDRLRERCASAGKVGATSRGRGGGSRL